MSRKPQVSGAAAGAPRRAKRSGRPERLRWLGARSGEPLPPPPGAPDAGYPPLADAPESYLLEA